MLTDELFFTFTFSVFTSQLCLLMYSYMEQELYEEAVRDYEKITKMDHNHGMYFIVAAADTSFS